MGLASITVAGSLLTEKYSSFCTCSVRVLCELGPRKGTNCRSKEDRPAITTSKMGGATVMLGRGVSAMPRLQPPPRRTQRADFPHCAPPFASCRGLWDLSRWDNFQPVASHSIGVEQP